MLIQDLVVEDLVVMVDMAVEAMVATEVVTVAATEEEEEDTEVHLEALVVEEAFEEALEVVEAMVVGTTVEVVIMEVRLPTLQSICLLLNQVSKFLSRIFLGLHQMKTWLSCSKQRARSMKQRSCTNMEGQKVLVLCNSLQCKRQRQPLPNSAGECCSILLRYMLWYADMTTPSGMYMVDVL